MIATAKVTSKGRTTIPQAVRKAMLVGPGDVIVWEIKQEGVVNVRRLSDLEVDNLHCLESTLSEWGGTLDNDAYRDF
ncbi:AbrB/MazE/SpoVT family DNA-binding domain-containing protein [Desulfonatronum thiodismutans]|uniref:AbrB/MazE/SpoVT family DNA-binding domain-containing protein n=1 Tax=Desulfonatronum thiodismutans TaxID=159290 RepID=UPI0004ABD62A|nr:type II toxin-antitoxin system PrlF family antitoxin [Desulfonatronum thiodismutans]